MDKLFTVMLVARIPAKSQKKAEQIAERVLTKPVRFAANQRLAKRVSVIPQVN